MVTVHETILPLGAAVWAAVEKSPGYTPEGLIAEIRRNSRYPLAEWRALAGTKPVDPNVVILKRRDIVDVVTVHETILPLGAAVWAAVEKSPDTRPKGWLLKSAVIRVSTSRWRALAGTEPIDPNVVIPQAARRA